MSDDAATSGRLASFVGGAARYGKPAVVFCCSDSDAPIPCDGAWVFRTSLSRSGGRPRECALPAWSEDFVTSYLDGRLPLRRYARKPIIGFCGYVGTELRSRALRVLSESSHVTPNLVMHDQFWAGALSSRFRRASRMRAAREQFVRNLVESDYALCIRGAGNFSYRPYEALSCGRTPVFINTDCVLPFDETIDWRRLCVWVESRDIDMIDRKIVEFHDALDEAAFQQRQHECRRIWEEWLSPSGFHRHLLDGIRER